MGSAEVEWFYDSPPNISLTKSPFLTPAPGRTVSPDNSVTLAIPTIVICRQENHEDYVFIPLFLVSRGFEAFVKQFAGFWGGYRRTKRFSLEALYTYTQEYVFHEKWSEST